MITEINGKTATRYEHWGSELPTFAKHLRVWGEAGVVKTKQIKTPKVADRGVICMFTGYSLDHAGDCYRMFNPKTKRIVNSRDIRWLKSMFFTTAEASNDKVREITWIDVDNDDLDPPPSDAREGEITMVDEPEVNADLNDTEIEGTAEGDNLGEELIARECTRNT